MAIQLEQRTQDVKISEDITFETMLLNKRTLKGLRNMGFYRPSPVQLHGIPLGKCGFDLLLEAKSGTGKTAVFTIITLEKLDLNKGLQAIILAPTREIAAQVCDVIKQIGSKYEGLIVEVVMGGLPLQDDIEKLKNHVHIIVGSPGRLKHLIQDNHIDVSSVKILVLDECDKLMDKSFLPDVNYIFSELPNQKQVIMSSATYPENCITFINKYVNSAQHICPNSNSILIGISQHVTTVPYNNNIVKQTDYKFQELIKILSYHQYKQCLIFCNYVARVRDIHKRLKREAWPAEVLHGQQEQTHRLNTLKSLQQYECRILISTDLAARGIDASNVDLVINFEPPSEWQTYLHRIGRAGRFGSYGIAVTILSEGKEVNKFKTTLKTMQIPIILQNIWTDEKFDIESLDNDSSQHHKDFKKQDPKITTLEHSKDITTRLSKVEEKDDNDFSNVWDLLIREENKNVDSCQSFEQLLISYQEANVSKIETFSDLLESFKNVEDISSDNEKSMYKCIIFREYSQYFKKRSFNSGTETLLNNNVFINLGVLTNNVCKKKEELDNNYSLIKQNNCLKINNNNIPTDTVCQRQEDNILFKNENGYLNLNKIYTPTGQPNGCPNQEESDDNNYYTKEISDLNLHEKQLEDDNYCTKENSYLNRNGNGIETNNVCQKEKQLDSNNYVQKENSSFNLSTNKQTLLGNDDKRNNSNDIIETERALLEAGLPTSFEGTKQKKKRSKVNNKNIKGKKVIGDCISDNRSYDLAKDKCIKSGKGKTISFNESNKNYDSYKTTLTKRADKVNKTIKKDVTSTTCNISEGDSHFDYDVWYNQLKSHMKYVEYSFYIEEMSNL